MNVPYVKSENPKFFEKNQKFTNVFPNRRTRRQKEPPFIGNGKSFPLTVFGGMKYKRVIQRVADKNILHYIQISRHIHTA